MIKDYLNMIIVESSTLIREKIVDELNSFDKIEIIGKVKNNTEFLKLKNKNEFDIVLMDIDLDDGKGIELIKTIRTINKEIKIIIFTNLSGKSYRNLSIEMGVHSFFDKSGGFEPLINKLKEIEICIS